MGKKLTTVFLLSSALIFFEASFCRAETQSVKKYFDIQLKIKEKVYNLKKQETANWLSNKTDLTINLDYLTEIENNNLCQYLQSPICDLTFSSNQKLHIKKISSVNVDQKAIENFLDKLANEMDEEPKNAKFKIEDGKVSMFSLSKKGISLDKEKSLKKIMDFFQENSNPFSENSTLELPFSETEAEIGIDSIENMGITTLIGQGKSNFRGSTNSRIHNIKTATAKYDGLLIKPNEEFSFVKILGEVDEEHGYLPELVIKKDKTEPEFGGGICQVSTTAFRAAIYSGLEITARRNHAYPVSYYNPQGMDATVYVPRPDLRFVNNTPGYILIQTEIKGTELTFNFYGTDDGRKVEVDGPTILEKNADGSMKTSFTQKVFDKNGNSTMESTFKSNYDSPDKYPHPTTTEDVLTEKPKSWSDNEWKKYKKEHGL